MRKNKDGIKKPYLLSVEQIREKTKSKTGQIVLGILCFSLLSFFVINLRSFIFASEYFSVSEIEITGKHSGRIDYPLTRLKNNSNIFKVNLNKISRRLKHEHPDVQRAIVKRVMPNKLLIEILQRHPVAQIVVRPHPEGNSKRYLYSVNEDGYILANLGTRQNEEIPVIKGAGLNLKRIEVGRRYNEVNLQCALSFLKVLNKSGFTRRYKVTKIDVTNLRSMSFFIDHRLEVKIGNKNWDKKVENLGSILQSMNIDYSQDYYMDLRFKDFVFGKK